MLSQFLPEPGILYSFSRYSTLQRIINNNHEMLSYLQIQNSFTKFKGVGSGFQNCLSRHFLKSKVFSPLSSHSSSVLSSSWPELSCSRGEIHCQGPTCQECPRERRTKKIFFLSPHHRFYIFFLWT